METTPVETSAPSGAAALQIQLGVCFLAFILIGCSDSAFGVLLPTFSHYYGVDKATIALIFFTATVGGLGASLSSGLLVAAVGQRNFLLVGLSAFLLAMVIFVAQPAFVVFLLAFVFLGFGSGVIDAGLNGYVAALPNNTAHLNYLHACYGVGAIVGPVVAATILTANLGWNSVYLLWTGLGAVVLLGVARFLTAQGRAAKAPGESNRLTAVLRLPALGLVAAFLFLLVGVEVGLGNWSYSFLTEARLQPTQLAAGMVSGYWLGLTGGRLVLGKLSTRLGKQHLIHLALAGTALGIGLIWLGPSDLIVGAGMVLTGLSVGPIFPTMIALLADLAPPRLLPSAIGLIASLGSVGGAFFPWVIGNLAQAFSLWIFMPYLAALTVILALLWLAVAARRAAPAPV